MALLLDIEPPSSQDDKKKVKSNIWGSHKAGLAQFWSKVKNQVQRLYFLWAKFASRCRKIGEDSIIFGRELIGNKYLPHFTIGVLFALVAFSNIHDRVQAAQIANDYASIDPDIESSVADSLDHFTPMIMGDASFVDKATTASSYSDGFATTAAPSTTQITERTTPLPDNSSSSVYYIVQAGDTLSALGMKFGVKLATLKYLNDLNTDTIKPGLRLKVPERGYEVSPTLIAKKNAQTLASSSRSTVTRSNGRTLASTVGRIQNAYPFGWCTYYVATRRAVPARWGNAGQWLNSAKRGGYATGKSPQVGAIVVTAESFWGHVAYVEKVNGDEITVSEMNAPIWGVVTSRTMSAYGGKVKGYIY